MKLTIFGATGQTGMEVVKQALEAGHEVNAFVRDADKMTLQNEKLKVLVGDILKPETIAAAVERSDGVILALGSKPDTATNVLSEGTTNIINSMKSKGVNRLIVQSSFPMSGAPESMAFLKSMMPEEQIQGMKPMIDDKIGQEKVVQESGLDWTIVRPMFLTNEAKTGKYRVGEQLEVTAQNNISRADVADFMLKEVAEPKNIGKIIIISNN